MAPRPMAALLIGPDTMVARTTAARLILTAQSPPVLLLAQRRAQPVAVLVASMVQRFVAAKECTRIAEASAGSAPRTLVMIVG